MTLLDQENLCAFARFCDPGGKIWSLIERTDDATTRELVIREAAHCPSGRLVVVERKRGRPSSRTFPASIGVVEDPAMECSGPLWVRGGIGSSPRTGPPTSDATGSPCAGAGPLRTSRSATAATPASGFKMACGRTSRGP